MLVIALATIGDEFTRLAGRGRQIEAVSASVLRSVQVLPDGERSVVERPRRSVYTWRLPGDESRLWYGVPEIRLRRAQEAWC